MARALFVLLVLGALVSSSVAIYLEGQAPQDSDDPTLMFATGFVEGEPLAVEDSDQGVPKGPGPLASNPLIRYKGAHPDDDNEENPQVYYTMALEQESAPLEVPKDQQWDPSWVRRGGGAEPIVVAMPTSMPVPRPLGGNKGNKCPKGVPMVNCLVDPCTTTLCAAGTKCRSNYCGGCNAMCEPIKGSRPTCKPGFSFSAKTKKCSPCISGYFSDRGVSCRPCPAEYYAQHKGSSMCNKCTGNTTTFGKIAQTGCGMKN